MRSNFIFLIVLLFGGLASCSLDGKIVTYEVADKGSSPVIVVPVATATFKNRVSSAPVDPGFYPPGVGTSLFSMSPGYAGETRPSEIFTNLGFYHNSVLVRDVQVTDGDFERVELAYPFYPTQVHFIYYFSLTELESDNFAEIPADTGFTSTELSPSSVRVQWNPLVRKSGPATGVRYRAVIQPIGVSFSHPAELLVSETDIYSTDFQDLSATVNYNVKIYFGNVKGHLGSYPIFSFQKQ